MLVVTGNKDRLIVPATARRLAAAIPRAEVLRLTPGGHMVLLERGAELASAVGEFAGRVLPPVPVEAAPS